MSENYTEEQIIKITAILREAGATDEQAAVAVKKARAVVAGYLKNQDVDPRPVILYDELVELKKAIDEVSRLRANLSPVTVFWLNEHGSKNLRGLDKVTWHAMRLVSRFLSRYVLSIPRPKSTKKPNTFRQLDMEILRSIWHEATGVWRSTTAQRDDTTIYSKTHPTIFGGFVGAAYLEPLGIELKLRSLGAKTLPPDLTEQLHRLIGSDKP